MNLRLLEWTARDYAELQGELKRLSDEKYRAFNAGIVADPVRELYGVRVPELRRMAGEIAKGDVSGFLEVSCGEAHEEVLLEGLTVAASKLPYEARLRYYERRLCPRITNWAICDSVVGGERDREHLADALRLAKSARPFTARFGLVRLLSRFVTPEHIANVLRAAEGISSPHYYVKMAVAWLVSVCYVKFPQQTSPVLQRLDAETAKMARQKLRDSRRVPQEGKPPAAKANKIGKAYKND